MRHNTGDDQCTIQILRIIRDHHHSPQKKNEQKDYTHRSEQAKFLTNDRKNHIILRLRHIAKLLKALSESFAKQLARTDRIQTLHRLIALVACRLRMQPCIHSITSVSLKRDQADYADHADSRKYKERLILRIGHKKHAEGNTKDNNCRT